MELELTPAGPLGGELEQLGAHSSSGASAAGKQNFRSHLKQRIRDCFSYVPSFISVSLCLWREEARLALSEAPAPTAPWNDTAAQIGHQPTAIATTKRPAINVVV